MRWLRGRALNPEGDGDCYLIGCLSPPSPPEFHSSPAHAPAPTPAPAPLSCPPWIDPFHPVFAPAPAPVHGPGGGRRDQGGVHGYGSPPGVGGGGHDSHRRVVTYALIAVAAIFFVSLILLGVSVAVRRRQVRRRRQALLAAPAAVVDPDAPTDADDDDGPEGGGGVVHHVWYIRTVGLDEAAIHSIAATRYRAGAGLLGAADCTVCLGEFQDGELVRLLPKCGHAFHVPCIDTWLRAHVTCPLCRSDVLDPAVTADSGGTGGGDAESVASTPDDPVANDNAAAEEEADATSDAMAEQEQEESNNNRVASPAEDQEDQHEQSSVPEPQPPQLPCPRPQNVRRAASMDAAIVSTVAAALERLPEAAPEEEMQSGRRKRAGTGPSGAKESGSGHRSNLSTDRPASVGISRSFFSRHCRARSSVLPL